MKKATKFFKIFQLIILITTLGSLKFALFHINIAEDLATFSRIAYKYCFQYRVDLREIIDLISA